MSKTKPAPAPPDLNDPATRAEVLAAVIAECWRTGNLEYRLKSTQQVIRGRLANNPHRRHFLLCSRRLGKTDLLFTHACEVALRKPNARILYLAPHTKDAALLAQDSAAVVLKDCPERYLPTFNAQDKEFRFYNKSVIRLKGVNGETAQYLRGGAYDLVILDEAGLMDDFRHVLNDIVEPMVLTTRGHVLIATTPPRVPDHESTQVYEQYAAAGSVSVFTLRDADEDLIPFEEKCRALVSAGEKISRTPGILRGELECETTTALREFFCKFVTDASLAIVPEFSREAQKEIVLAHPRPPHFDYYMGIDPGSRDNTGIVWAYVDFTNGKLVVEDEALLQNPTTKAIVQTIQTVERTTFEGQEPAARVSDTDLRLIQDLRQLYGLRVSPARKDDMLASVNMLRHLVQNRQIIIHPRCTNLVRQLENAIWNNKANDMARAGENSPDKHYDCVAALRYLIRAVNWKKNPYPEGWSDPGGGGGLPLETWVSPRARGAKAKKGWSLWQDNPLTRRLKGK